MSLAFLGLFRYWDRIGFRAIFGYDMDGMDGYNAYFRLHRTSCFKIYIPL